MFINRRLRIGVSNIIQQQSFPFYYFPLAQDRRWVYLDLPVHYMLKIINYFWIILYYSAAYNLDSPPFDTLLL